VVIGTGAGAGGGRGYGFAGPSAWTITTRAYTTATTPTTTTTTTTTTTMSTTTRTFSPTYPILQHHPGSTALGREGERGDHGCSRHRRRTSRSWDVPRLNGSVHGTGNERPRIGGVKGHRRDEIAVTKDPQARFGTRVPQSDGTVNRRRQHVAPRGIVGLVMIVEAIITTVTTTSR
jgi:hypothetical protein